MKIRNMNSTRTGNPVANQFEIEHDGKHYFQSYASLIACVDWQTPSESTPFDGVLTLGRDWDYSRTTMKYLNAFIRSNASRIFEWYGLEVNASSIRKLIAKGVIRYDANMI